MPKITIDNREIECRDGVPVLQAALEAGWDVPHYCYHPGLSIVASCRLCLMEMQAPHPKTGEMGWMPKLVPSCQTPVRDGMVVRFDSETVRANQESCMEYFLLNHPLDCPVCDQAGECYLQDYSFEFGRAESRMVDQKYKNPKKDIGPKTLLYSDRCVMCSRCVRFTDEISGTHELCITQRGSRAEIDVFPGLPLDNPMQGNVVDICPVGCLLDKDFLFKQRVWFMSSAESVCAGCATGCSIRIDHNKGQVWRLKPRFNPEVNDWWICDEGRFGWKYVHDKNRIASPRISRRGEVKTPDWADLPEMVRFRLTTHLEETKGGRLAVVLSPFMACEEAWLLVRTAREIDANAALVRGPIPYEGDDQHFPVGATGDAVKFTILKEKCPNRRGIEMILEGAGGDVLEFDAFVKDAKSFAAAWLYGGYPKEWLDKDTCKALAGIDLLILSDLFQSPLVDEAEIVTPACPWTERDGCFVNVDGKIQAFDRAVAPMEGAKMDGQFLYELAGLEALYRGERVRELMMATMPQFGVLCEAPAKPVHSH